MLPVLKLMLINLALIIGLIIFLYYTKDRINRFVNKVFRRSSKKISSYSNQRYKKKIQKIEQKNLKMR